MGWLQDWLKDLEGEPAPSLPPTRPVRAAVPRKPKIEIKETWFQTRPSSEDDPGEIEAVFYSVADGVLRLHNADGKPIDKEYRLAPGDDARTAARRLARAAWQHGRGEGDFNRPLSYARHGIA
jgi:hypothetical protein